MKNRDQNFSLLPQSIQELIVTMFESAQEGSGHSLSFKFMPEYLVSHMPGSLIWAQWLTEPSRKDVLITPTSGTAIEFRSFDVKLTVTKGNDFITLVFPYDAIVCAKSYLKGVLVTSIEVHASHADGRGLIPVRVVTSDSLIVSRFFPLNPNLANKEVIADGDLPPDHPEEVSGLIAHPDDIPLTDIARDLIEVLTRHGGQRISLTHIIDGVPVTVTCGE